MRRSAICAWARPLCFLRTDPTDNGYARPIEGLRPVVNIDTMEVLRVENYGYVPLPPNAGNYAAEKMTNFRTDIKPLEIIQSEGPSFEVKGYEVSWQKWNFVIGFNAREGLTLHDLSYKDGDEKRSILYRASLSEMVVPYGDPTDNAIPQKCLRQRRVWHGYLRQQFGAGLRLPGFYPLFRCTHDR